MRRLEVRFRPAALGDLDEVYRYVSGSATIQARLFVSWSGSRIVCRNIGHAPHGGRPRDDLEAGLRTVPFERRAVIAYRVEEDCVRIVNIFYGGRDFEALYRRRLDPDA